MTSASPAKRLRFQCRQLLPLAPRLRLGDRLVARTGRAVPMRCPVCGRVTRAAGFTENLRDSGACALCGATNRQRQVAWALLNLLDGSGRSGLSALSMSPLRIFHAEAAGPIHQYLAGNPGYVCSEFVGPDRVAGEEVEGTRHEDVQDLSFGENSFDLVITTDILEHVPDPYRAHREIFRVLTVGGSHLFTVPFLHGGLLDQERCRVGADGEITHLLEPQYHHDPLRDGGALVYRLFAMEMLVRLAQIGFTTTMYDARSPRHGIYGNNAFVFIAQKHD